MLLFSDLVRKDSARWNPDIKAFGNLTSSDGKRVDAGRLILDALSKDRRGIAIANVHYTRPEVKVLGIAARAGTPFVTPTRETVQNLSSPLTRSVFIFLNCPPKHPLDAVGAEFVRYVLSREGQRDIEAEGAYLPLPMGLARKELARLASL